MKIPYVTDLYAFSDFQLSDPGFKLRKARVTLYVLVQLLFSLLFPVCIILARLGKSLTGVPAAEGLGLISIMIISLIVLFPASFLHGSLFSLHCRLSGLLRKNPFPVAKVYIIELAGTVIGGLLVYLLVLRNIPSLQAAMILASVNILVMIPLVGLGTLKRNRRQALMIITKLLLLIMALIPIVLIINGSIDGIHQQTLDYQWAGHNVIHYRNSPYGNIVVTQEREQLTFFVDGQPVVISPDSDISFTETLVHFAMLTADNPQNVLVIGGGAGGVINEIIKYPVDKVHYTELDPLLPELIRQYPTPLTQRELQHPAVEVISIDGRRFVQQSEDIYDVVILGIDTANDLQTNRLFTVEFFNKLAERMSGRAVLSLIKPGSFSYLSEDLQYMNRISKNSLKNVFAHVAVIPCENNLYLASKQDLESRLTPENLISGMEIDKDFNGNKKRQTIETGMLSEAYIRHLLQPYRIEWFADQIADVTETLNTDYRPLLLLHTLAYHNSMVAPVSHEIFRFIRSIDMFKVITALLIIAALYLTLLLLTGSDRLAVFGTVFSTGFSGMLFDLALIYIFQVAYGYVFGWIGMLFVAYMVGAGMGASYNQGKTTAGPLLKSLLNYELSITFFALLIILLTATGLQDVISLHPFIFLLLPFAAGFITGSQFPLAVELHRSYSKGDPISPGSVYAADLSGGFAGGLLGGVLLLPLLGIGYSMLTVAMVKLLSIIGLLITKRKH